MDVASFGSSSFRSRCSSSCCRSPATWRRSLPSSPSLASTTPAPGRSSRHISPGTPASALYLVPLTDRLGPKRIIYLSAALSVAAPLLFPLATHNVAVGVALRAIAGVGFLGIYIPGLQLVARRFERSGRGSAMGLFVTAQYASHSGSLALTGWLMAAMEWRDAYALVAAASAVSLPMIFLLVRSVPKYAPTAHGR